MCYLLLFPLRPPPPYLSCSLRSRSRSNFSSAPFFPSLSLSLLTFLLYFSFPRFYLPLSSPCVSSSLILAVPILSHISISFLLRLSDIHMFFLFLSIECFIIESRRDWLAREEFTLLSLVAVFATRNCT